MKNSPLSKYNMARIKIFRCIESCQTMDQLNNAANMIVTFRTNFKPALAASELDEEWNNRFLAIKLNRVYKNDPYYYNTNL